MRGALDEPGRLPDPSTITLETILGDHVVVRHRDVNIADFGGKD
jgi:hypothetical protein